MRAHVSSLAHDPWGVTRQCVERAAFTASHARCLSAHNTYVLQIAFQYSLLIYRIQKGAAADAGSEEGGGPPRVYELQRRLRVLTIAPQVARTAEPLYAGLRVEPSMTLLMHKAVRHAARESVADARLLLQVCTYPPTPTPPTFRLTSLNTAALGLYLFISRKQARCVLPRATDQGTISHPPFSPRACTLSPCKQPQTTYPLASTWPAVRM